MNEWTQGLAMFSADETTFATSDLHEGMRYVTEKTSHTLRPLEPKPEVEMMHWRFSLENTHLDLIKLTCGGEFIVGRTGESNYFTFQFPMVGVCQIEIGRDTAIASPGQVFAVNPHQELVKRWRGPCGQMMVQIERRAFQRLLVAELDHECAAPLIFDCSVQSPEIADALGAITLSVAQQLALHPALHHRRLLRSMERNLLLSYLTLLNHNYRDEFLRSDAAAAPYYVKRAENYIRLNLRNPVTIDELVEISGVSSRSLYYGFKRWRGTTPMSYLRSLRLALAREELKRAREEGGNVTRIALGVGYDHLSRFSKDYKLRFGESPSTTMLQG